MISVAAGDLHVASLDTAGELAKWRPKHGVISIYVDADPADRGGGWRIALRNALDTAAEQASEAERETRLAVEATVKRIRTERVSEEGEPPGRGLIGFIEASREPGEERWYATRFPPRLTGAGYGAAPRLAPLVALLDDYPPRGLAVLSTERVRLLHWDVTSFEQLHDWELEVFAEDWRERKSQRASAPPTGEMVSSSGRDQHDQRMAHNRQRFARETGGLTRKEARSRSWRDVLAIGDDSVASEFAEGMKNGCDVHHVDSSDLVSVPTAKVIERVQELLPGLNRERERALIERVREAAYSQGRGSFGPQETVRALEEGRAAHLLYDSGRDDIDRDRMIELALATSALITPVEDEAAEALAEHDSVAALLRY